MKNTLALLIVLALSLTLSGGTLVAAGSPRVLGELDFSRANPSLSVVNVSADQTSISLTAPDVVILDSTVGFHNFQYFAIPGEPPMVFPGQPALPQITRLYRIPNTGSIELVRGETEFEVVENVYPLPYNQNGYASGDDVLPDRSVYDVDAWFPPDVVSIGSPAIFRDFRVVQLTLYPVQVNPARRLARVYSRIAAEIIANDLPGENELTNPRPPSGAFAPLYRGMIANLDESALDEVSIVPGSYMIICRNDPTVMQWADSLATWKRRMGYNVVVDARASWTAPQMRSAIQAGYSQWDPPLEFACLIGDQTGTYQIPTGGGDYDHYFALGNSGDDFEDIGVGRLSVQSSTHLQTVIKKQLGYERTPYMTDPAWFQRVFLYAGTGSGISSNYDVMSWGREQFRHFTGVNAINIATHSGNVSETLIGQQLTAGVSFFLWRGTVIGEMGNSAATSMQPSWKLPIVLTITCGTGEFSNNECLSEAWLRAGSATAPEGGVCGIGTATVQTHVHFNNTVAGGLIYNICNLGVEHLSLALAGAKVQLYAAFPGQQGSAADFSRWNNLMGEPSLLMWTDAPVVTEVTYPGTVNVGTRQVSVHVAVQGSGAPVPDAIVVLWKGSETYARARTDANGDAIVPVTVNTPGSMSITVTKRNHKPYLADIACVSAPLMVALSSYTVDDDNQGGTSGNSDGMINPGETIELPLNLRNFGQSETATGVYAILNCNHPAIAIVRDSSAFGIMAPGDSSLSSTPFRFYVSPTIQHRDTILFTLTVNANSQIVTSAFRMVPRASHAVFETSVVSGGDGDNYLERGEQVNLRVTVRNRGVVDMVATTGELRSLSNFVSVLSGIGNFGTIVPNSTGSNSGSEFVLRAHDRAFPGTQINFLLVLNTEGHLDSVAFALPLGLRAASDPTGPDAYGYYAYDNTDTSYEMSRAFQYVPINTIGTNLNLNDTGDPGHGTATSTARRLPFPFTFYGQTYDTVTITSNGWMAFGNQSDQDQFRNYPIPGQQAPDAMIAPFWDNLKTSGTGLGVWMYSQPDSHRFIVQWRAQGAYNTNTQDFEVILLDPAHYRTRSGNGIVIVQYNQVSEMVGDGNDIPYSTVGIQAPGCLVGLQYRFYNMAAPGAASLVPGRCIVFTTESQAVFGTITGTVTDAESGLPLPGAAVSVDGQGYRDTTDATGGYTLDNVLAGTYAVRAGKFGFNDRVVEDVVVETDSAVTVNLALLHPEIALSVSEVSVSLPRDSSETTFQVTNGGNGVLTYNVTIHSNPPGSLDDAWDYLTGIDLTDSTGDQQIMGCEQAGGFWWITGNGSGIGRAFYRFDADGNFVDEIPQPESSVGWFDMAYDGEFLYGSGGDRIVGIDLNGVPRDTIESPLNPTRALAYDVQTDHFWVGDYLWDIYEIDRDGTVLRRFSSNLRVTGLAWNPGDAMGYKLYIFCQDSQSWHARVYKMHPVSGDKIFVIQLDDEAGDRAGGCTITGGWNNTLLVFAGIIQGPTDDRLGVWELDFNTSWITVDPASASVDAGTSRDVRLVFHPEGLRDAVYHAYLRFQNNTADGPLILPVTLSLSLPFEERASMVPLEYALHQNYPNPFNSGTTIRYDVRQPGHTTLRVYNLLGEQVALLVDRFDAAGSYRVNLELPDAASGIYVCRLHSGSYEATRKLLLIK